VRLFIFSFDNNYAIAEDSHHIPHLIRHNRQKSDIDRGR
jgi:hypothetical protein